MINWHDKSDSISTFFDGEVCDEGATSVDAILTEVIAFLLSNIIGKRNAADFDRLFLEVNCDTGRVLVAATTHEKRRKGQIDGCSVRIQRIQDHWYDLVESGKPDQEFTQAIAAKVTEVGQICRRIISEHLAELRKSCSKQGFRYIVFGSDHGVAYVDEPL
jgi:hypothetical protein